MQSEPHPLPSQHGQFDTGRSYSPYDFSIPVSLPYDLIRLHQEKDFLSMQLADYVTYLTALRERRATLIRQLNVKSTLPQKKRKRLQQTKRHLDIVMKNRERDEKACLNNLQACETNIILANIKVCQLANVSFQPADLTTTPTLYTPTLCSISGSEATDLTWEGWTDEAALSPFQKKASSPFIDDDFAPDTCAEGDRRDSAMAKDSKRPPPLSQDAEELSNSLPVPPNTAQSQYRGTSVLSPEAAVFQPAQLLAHQYGNYLRSAYKRSSMSSATTSVAKEILQARRFSAAGIAPTVQRRTICQPSAEHLPGQTGCNSTPQPHPQKNAGVPLKRERTNSL